MKLLALRQTLIPTASMIVCLAASNPAVTQADGAAQTGSTWLSGYQQELHGEQIGYNSALPEVNSALLVRSLESERSIAWQTPPMPEVVPEEGVALTWLFGMDANPEQHVFRLLLNGEQLLSFQNPVAATTEAWSVSGLTFRPTFIDRHQDVFGFAVLQLPPELVTPGKSMKLEVVGESAGSWIWYMTFRHSPRETVRMTEHNALRRTEDMGTPQTFQEMMLEVVHLGEPVQVRVDASWGFGSAQVLKLGANRLWLYCHNESKEASAEVVSLTYPDGRRVEVPMTLKPVKPWVIHLVQHTHTDLGYTRPQTEILADHLRYIDFALDYCDQTDHFPDDAKFRWTCEAAWPVQEYLRYRPKAQIDRLRQRIAEGRIELTGMFANMSELLDERACAASLAPIAEMRRHGLPVESAMQNDVNGIAWIYADLLSEMGVRYLTMGEHGHRALIPFDVPTAFWWESPSGSRMLAWRPDHYNTGNFWGVHSGDVRAVEPAVFQYLGEITRNGYTMDHISVQYGGVFLDNAPPGIKANELIRDWNKKYVWPRMRSSLGTELPKWVEANHADSLQTFRAAWPDWWSDGIASAPREVAAVRNTQNQLAATESMLAMARAQGIPVSQHLLDRIARTWEQLVIYGEHTYGAAESVTDPEAENTQVQWAEKSAFAWDAVKEAAILQEAAFGLMQNSWPRSEHPTIVVTNTLSWPRSGLAKIFLDKELLTPGQIFHIVDGEGNVAPAQLWKAQHDGNWWAIHVDGVPSFGWKAYSLIVTGTEEAWSKPADVSGVLETGWTRVVVDPKLGGVTSIKNMVSLIELVDPATEWSFGQLIHEKLGNRWQLEHFLLDDFERVGIGNLELHPGDAGPLWKSVIMRGSAELAPDPNGVEIEVRLYQHEPVVEFRYRIRKRPSTDPESLYAAFQFHKMLAYPGLRPTLTIGFDSAGSEINPVTQQIPRTSADWHAANRFVELDNESIVYHLSSPDILLHQFGGIQLGKFRQHAATEKPHVFSWLFNNYWVTNFLADQSGELTWTQSIHVGLPTVPGDEPPGASHFSLLSSWERFSPMPTRVLPPNAQSQGGAPHEYQVLQIDNQHVALVNARPIADGNVLLQLRELHGVKSKFQVRDADGNVLALYRADANGDLIKGQMEGKELVWLLPHSNSHFVLGKPAND